MPYFLSPLIKKNMPSQFNEGSPYSSNTLIDIKKNAPNLPPVHYDEHLLRPHSLTHMEFPLHTNAKGKTLTDFFMHQTQSFFGRTLLLQFEGDHWKKSDQNENSFHWEISIETLKNKLAETHFQTKNRPINRVLISAKSAPITAFEMHDPNYALTLSSEAATWLIEQPGFCLFGTSYRSTDYQPHSRNRPIHEIIFKKACILENLKLHDVPEGEYFLVASPIPLDQASEVPVSPVLFTQDEMKAQIL